MQRDMSLVRDLLLAIEAKPAGWRGELKIDGSPFDVINYHLRIMSDAGLIFSGADHGGQMPVLVKGLTWDGHQFLDSIRSDDVWSKIRKAGHLAGAISLTKLMEIAAGLALDKLKHVLGLPL